MCRSEADGGQRCAAHTRAALVAAESAHAASPGPRSWEALQKARAEHASTPTGRDETASRAAALPTGSDEQDDLLDALRRGAHLRERALAAAGPAPDIGRVPATPTQSDRDLAWAKSKMRMHGQQLDVLREQEQRAQERLADAAPDEQPRRERDLHWARESLRLHSASGVQLRAELAHAQGRAAGQARPPEQEHG